MDNAVQITVSNLNFFYGKTHALKNMTMDIYKNKVTAIIGPSGCGKSTFIRLFNRMNDLVLNTRTEGHIYIDGKDILSPKTDVVALRRKVGMVFQKPNPFPKSIYRNISYGLEVNNIKDKTFIEKRVTESLKNSALWEEIKGRLNDSALMLSGGQQQRLCIARCLAVEPEVILFDEPCASLDPISTRKIEKLITELKKKLYDYHSNAQYATGGASLRLHRFPVFGRTCGIRNNREIVYSAVQSEDGRISVGKIRIRE